MAGISRAPPPLEEVEQLWKAGVKVIRATDNIEEEAEFDKLSSAYQNVYGFFDRAVKSYKMYRPDVDFIEVLKNAVTVALRDHTSYGQGTSLVRRIGEMLLYACVLTITSNIPVGGESQDPEYEQMLKKFPEIAGRISQGLNGVKIDLSLLTSVEDEPLFKGIDKLRQATHSNSIGFAQWAVEAFLPFVEYGSVGAKVATLLLRLRWHLAQEAGTTNWVQQLMHVYEQGRGDKQRMAEILHSVLTPLKVPGISKHQHKHFTHLLAEYTPSTELRRVLDEEADSDTNTTGREMDMRHGESQSLAGYWYNASRSCVGVITKSNRGQAYTLSFGEDEESYTLTRRSDLDRPDMTMGYDAYGLGGGMGIGGMALMGGMGGRGGRLRGYDRYEMMGGMARQETWECIATAGRLARYGVLHLGQAIEVLINPMDGGVRTPDLSMYRDKRVTEPMASFIARALQPVLAVPPDNRFEQTVREALESRRSGTTSEVVDAVRRNVRRCHPETMTRFLLHPSVSMPPKVVENLAEGDPGLNVIGVLGRLLAHSGASKKTQEQSVVRALRSTMSAHVDFRCDDPIALLSGIISSNRHDFDGTWSWYFGTHFATAVKGRRAMFGDAFTISGHFVRLHHPGLSGLEVSHVRYGEDSVSIYVTQKADAALDRSKRTVQLCLMQDGSVLEARGFWRFEDAPDMEWTNCMYTRKNAPTVEPMAWDTPQIKKIFSLLIEMVSSWQSAEYMKGPKKASRTGRDVRMTAYQLICSVFPSHVPEMKTAGHLTKPFKMVLSQNPPGLWMRVCEQILQSYDPKQYTDLDAWVLPEEGTDLSTLTGIRRNAAEVLLAAYAQRRGCLTYVGSLDTRHSRVPPYQNKVNHLAQKYPAMQNLVQKMNSERTRLQQRLDAECISSRDYKQALTYEQVHVANGLRFPATLTLEAFNEPIAVIEKARQVYLLLVKEWGLQKDNSMQAELDSKLSNSMTEDLQVLKDTVKRWEHTLSRFLMNKHLISSETLKSYFTKTAGGTLVLAKLHETYKATCENLQRLTLNDTVEEVLGGMSLGISMSEGYKKQESVLLQEVGMKPDVVRAVLEGAHPLREMVNALGSFRELVQNPPEGMRLREDFLNDREKTVLMFDAVADVTLAEAEGRVAEIKKMAYGCDLRVLKVIEKMLECEALVVFTRDHPSAQDSGLADVLSNTKDIQHASFQAFLNCAPFVNPFVAASKSHQDMFLRQKAAVEEEEERESMSVAEASRVTRLRLCVNNRDSDDPAVQPEGFWELLNAAFTDDLPVATVLSSLEKMNSKGQLEGLNKMLTEQNTVTDRMVGECARICGVEHEGAQQAGNVKAAKIYVHLPVMGSPHFTVKYGGFEKTGADYDDLVFRATLQRSIDPVLETFTDQAGYVTQAFDLACQLFAEGHIEFRSRVIVFDHPDAEMIVERLRALLGRWSDESAGQSLLGLACAEYPTLSRLSSAELVRLADLLRGVASVGEAEADNALTHPWRRGRVQLPMRKSDGDQPKLTTVAYLKHIKTVPPRRCGDAPVVFSLSHCGPATGDYTPTMRMYRRHDGAVLCPVAQGWVLYVPKALGVDPEAQQQKYLERYLVSTSEHNGHLKPWAMDQWFEANKDGILGTLPSKVLVQVERKYRITAKWAEESSADKTKYNSIKTQEKLPVLPTTVVDGVLYVGVVEEGSMYEARGLEEGMRVRGVLGVGEHNAESLQETSSDPAKLVKALKAAVAQKDSDGKVAFAIQADAAWIWDSLRVPTDVKLDTNCRCATMTKKAASGALSYVTSKAPTNAKSWRVRFVGDLEGVVVGLVPANFQPGAPQGYWCSRDGAVWSSAKPSKSIDMVGAFKEGDVITVEHKKNKVVFKKNDVVFGETACGKEAVFPCVGMRKTGCQAYLLPGTQVREVLSWDAARLPNGLKLTGTNIVSKKDKKDTFLALGDCVFRGPGPHTFRVRVKSIGSNDVAWPSSTTATPTTSHFELVKNIRVGLASRKAPRDQKSCKSADLFAISCNPVGSVYDSHGAVEKNCVQKMRQPAPLELLNYVLTCTLDLGDTKSFQVWRHAQQQNKDVRSVQKLLDTGDFTERVNLDQEGVFTPAVWFDEDTSGLQVELLPEPDTVGESDSAHVIVKGTKGGVADGLYEDYLPVLTRNDSAYKLSFWHERPPAVSADPHSDAKGRWCVTDPAERPVAWSTETNTPRKLGERPLKWTVVQGFEEIPSFVRIVTPAAPGGVLQKQDSLTEGRVWYANDELALVWVPVGEMWIVCPKAKANAPKKEAFYRAFSTERYPHNAGTWMVGTGAGWVQRANVGVVACHPSVPLRLGRDLAWDASQWGEKHTWTSAVSALPAAAWTTLSPRVDIQTHVVKKVSASQASAEMMMPDELVGWHLLKKATGQQCTVPQLRQALLETLKGGIDTGAYLNVSAWNSNEDAVTAVANAAAMQLASIGTLLGRLNKHPEDEMNFDPNYPWHGHLQGRTIKDFIVDVRNVSQSDQRLFVFGMFTGDLCPHHLLDCSQDIPLEDVQTFLAMYRRAQKGRFAVFGFQYLRSEAQYEIKTCLEQNHKEENAPKALYAIITGGDSYDETIESVDNNVCDPQWRKTSAEHVVKLNKLKSITYYSQPAGTGKSFAIDKAIAAGKWGSDVVPTRLDLDSTTEGMDAVCTRLLTPFLEPEGLLIVHVAHDTAPAFVNRVLDHLMFLGAVESSSGRYASITPGGWHMVVEFQTPPEPEPGHLVNPPWRSASGQSDITLLATRGLGVEGELLPFDVLIEGDAGPAVLTFLKQKAKLPAWMTALPDIKLLRLLASGSQEFLFDEPAEKPTDDPLLGPQFEELLESIPARTLIRTLRFAIEKHLRYVPKTNQPGFNVFSDKHELVARSIIHEMNFFTSTDAANLDHYHVLVSYGSVRKHKDSLLSGKMPKFVQKGFKSYMDYIQTINQGVSANPTAQSNEVTSLSEVDHPLISLLDMLFMELGVSQEQAALCLASKSYALTADFLQKIFQLNNHVRLNDPAILQGPSGTGKSYAVMILSELNALPSDSSRTGTAKVEDIEEKLAIAISNKPDNAIHHLVGGSGGGDLIVNGRTIFVPARQDKLKPHKPVQEALKVLSDATSGHLEEMFTLVKTCAEQYLGPKLMDPKTYPDLVGIEKKPRGGSVEALFQATEPQAIYENAKSVLDLLHSNLATRMLNGELVSLLKAAMLSDKMVELAGSIHPEIKRILTARPVFDALRLWAREVLSSNHLGRSGSFKSELLCNAVKDEISELLHKGSAYDVPPEVRVALADSGTPSQPTTQDALVDLITTAVTLKPKSPNCFVLMRYDMTVDMLFAQILPVLRNAVLCPNVKFMIMIDELNATKMLGLVKRLVVDRYWDRWADEEPSLQGKIPDNVAFVGAVNPSKKSAVLEGRTADEIDDEEDMAAKTELGFDVTPMPPSLMEFVVPWRQLAQGRMKHFVERLLRQSKAIFSASLPDAFLKMLSEMLFESHSFAQKECRDKRSTVSQRDIHRTMKVFDFFYKQGLDFTVLSTESGIVAASGAEQRALSAMLLALAIAYYFRFPQDSRLVMSKMITDLVDKHQYPLKVPFADVVKNAVGYYCDPKHLKLPDAVYAHKGLMENLFVQMVCFELRLAVILEGPPGTSKTLSNSIIRDNMTGSGPFWKDLCHIADICRYQGSSQSSADEIKRRCEDAYRKQRESDEAGMKHKRTLLFVDEAGLVKSETDDRKWALKVLHFYLEGANLASVLMTNQTLDPAIGNRCVVVYMGKPEPKELTNMCAGILCKQGMEGLEAKAQTVVDQCCVAFHTLIPPMSDKEELVTTGAGEKTYRWWYGLRDLFHMMRHMRRNQPSGSAFVSVAPEMLARALQRNFNGPPGYFNEVLRVFGATLSKAVGSEYSTTALQGHLVRNLEVIIDSIRDNNRAHETASGKNLNDMWVRFKLLVDNSDDGSLLQLLRHEKLKLPHFDNMEVLRLSALRKGDKFSAVAVVSQIAAAMESGKTVWLTNTREIDACLFELFNQNFVVANSGEVHHFAALAIGASLEYKRVHPNFQCIVHVMKEDLQHMGNRLPSPFLNRLEKFSISVDDVLEWMTRDMLEDPTKQLRKKLNDFDKKMDGARNRPLYSKDPSATITSLAVEMMAKGLVSKSASKYSEMLDPRIYADTALRRFIIGSDSTEARRRCATLRLLQLFQLDHMILGQGVLLNQANCYPRAYFRDLQPWSLTKYLANLIDEAMTATETLRSAVYLPANMDFMSLFEKLPAAEFLNVASLADSERGEKLLRERLTKFMSNPDMRVFGVLVTPELLGSPEAREVRWLIDELLADKTSAKQHKAVVILHSFAADMCEAKATPLFGTGWDQVYLDAAGERPDLNMLRYIDPNVVGVLPSTTRIGRENIEHLVPRALLALMRAQTTEWAPVADSDPAAALYNRSASFDDKLAIANQVMRKCPRVQDAFVELCVARLPTTPELIKMAKDLATEESGVSLAQRLVEEEERVFVKLLAYALQLMFDDRNASTIVGAIQADDVSLVEFCDFFISEALIHNSSRTTFDYLRNKKESTLPEISVRAIAPKVPGSCFLIEHLPVSATQTSARDAVEMLRAEHDGLTTGDLVKAVEQRGTEFVENFLRDCIRARLRMREFTPELVRCLDWVFVFVRGLHREIFGDVDVTVYSAHALCCVQSAAIDEYTLTMLPLANLGVLPEPPSLATHNEKDITHELCPALLLESAGSEITRNEFKVATACLLHRTSFADVVKSRSLPCLVVVGALLTDPSATLKDVAAFAGACAEIDQAGRLPIELAACKKFLDRSECTDRVALALLDLYVAYPEDVRLRDLVLQKMATGAFSRAMACRLMNLIVGHVTAPHVGDETREAALLELTPLADTLHALVGSPKPSGRPFPPPGQEALRDPGKSTPTDHAPETVNPVYVALWDSAYDFIIGIDGENVTGASYQDRARGLAKLLTGFPEKVGQMRPAEALLFSAVQSVAEFCLLQCLGVWFQPPVEGDKAAFVPSLLQDKDCAIIKAQAQRLCCPDNFTPPKMGTLEYGKMLMKPADDRRDYNCMLFLTVLDQGICPGRPGLGGMGLKGVMGYLMSHVKEKTDACGPIPTFFGPWMAFKCTSAAAPNGRSTAGDLPILYNQNEPLYGAYMAFNKQWLKANDKRNSEDAFVGQVLHAVEELLGMYSEADVRLLLYYNAVQEHYMQKQNLFCAKALVQNPKLGGMLSLGDKQKEFLHIILAPEEEEKLIWSKAFKNGARARDSWVMMVLTAGCVAAANPQTGLWAYCFESTLLSNSYLPGDKTGHSIQPGGGYKFDCVTQMSADGRLVSFAMDQPELSTGACYLLWGLEFGAFALQLGIDKSSYNLFARSMFSGTLTSGGSEDYLCKQFVERSRAYHFHMTTATSLKPDEARNVYAQMLMHYHADSKNDKLRRYKNKTRSDARECEKQYEAFWKKAIKPDNLSKAQMLCGGFAGGDQEDESVIRLARQLARFPATHMRVMDRTSDVVARLGNLSVGEAPKLLVLCKDQKDKLALLAPLLIEIFQFVTEIHTFLSGNLPEEHTMPNGDKMRSAYRGVLDVIKEHCHESQYVRLSARLASIKRRWNEHREKVGPVDYQCQEGGLDFKMEEHGPVGQAGLYETLDFWIHTNDVDPEVHRNLVHPAVLSLTQEYNKCQEVIQRYSSARVEQVHPMMLNPSKPDLMFTEPQDIARLARSYVKDNNEVDWAAVDAEIAFTTGLIIPPMAPVPLPLFRFAGEVTVDCDEAETAARDQLKLAPERHRKPMTDAQRADLTGKTWYYTMEQNVAMLEMLTAAFKQPDILSSAALGQALLKVHCKKPSYDNDMFHGMVAGQLRDVVRFFIGKVAKEDWKTANIEDAYRASIDAEIVNRIEMAIRQARETDAGELKEDIELVLSVLDNTVGENVTAKVDPEKDMQQDIAAGVFAVMFEDIEITKHFEGLKYKHFVSFLTRLKAMLKLLTKKSDRQHWTEKLGNSMETPVFLANYGDIRMAKGGGGLAPQDLGFKVETDEEDRVVVAEVIPGTVAEEAKMEQGLQMIRICGEDVESVGDFRDAVIRLSKIYDQIELSVGSEHMVEEEAKARVPTVQFEQSSTAEAFARQGTDDDFGRSMSMSMSGMFGREDSAGPFQRAGTLLFGGHSHDGGMKRVASTKKMREGGMSREPSASVECLQQENAELRDKNADLHSRMAQLEAASKKQQAEIERLRSASH